MNRQIQASIDVRIGIPSNWSDAPAAFQANLAALDRLENNELWRIAHSRRSEIDSHRLQDLLEKNAEGTLTSSEQSELNAEISEADRFMLRKAQAAALLQWRGHGVSIFPSSHHCSRKEPPHSFNSSLTGQANLKPMTTSESLMVLMVALTDTTSELPSFIPPSLSNSVFGASSPLQLECRFRYTS